ncbi:U6 small nuclear RNA (adenine-(43)-N(6))-methyltransferase [Acyrthosiphon pisum]|uniref:U6 small nuclear RNA (adenine-(43)-N(6))-methyltransferase n=1 Tax=Acyrthosiphon pisum TaxID=7029 RepID=A0A8R1W1Z0_ACYPI|nr:U6 small nuclear RNA (adenine-(43)-N(6))-methyltransferase [Acyrthosiphon pisum]XP_008182960.1 U6 small nuclear RNA (adenine-(43)-N(6))-methyltransferase [Acyrthosiphon pisum]|eukprot:XP_001948397.1 PREDICTED: methyltransferase-like protein 16 homolog [Acyrthosiphon pisum]
MPNNQFMHPRNIYRTPPAFKELAAKYPEFNKYASVGLNGKITFDFKNQDGLRLLTTILLKKDFDLDVDLPVGRLVPTVPLRLNYLLWIEDLFNLNYDNTKKIKGIDIGTGSSCIYPLLAAKQFQWSMVGTDINKESIKNAIKNVEKNNLQHLIQVLEVSEWERLLPVAVDEHYDFCMCNPPFHSLSKINSSDDEADSAVGITSEMYTIGGEVDFIKKMINESETLQNSISIYTTMVGYKSSLDPLKNELKAIGACTIAEAGFFQGRNARWGLAWTFQPDIKLKDFLPNKEFQKEKLKLRPPVSFKIPESYDSTTALAKLSELLDSLKLSISKLQSKISENVLYQADIQAYENTWTHQRRKRRMEKRLADCKRQKTNDSCLLIASDDERVDQHLETTVNAKPLFAATLVLRKSDNTILIDMLHLDGNRDNSYQVFQFFKNRFI